MYAVRSRLVPIAACLAIVLAACSDDKKSTTTDAAETTIADTTAPSTPDTSVDNSGDPFVKLADSAIGQILVDFDGNTLYLFTSDPPNTVTCTGGCASAWPPVFAPADFAVGEGLDKSLFTSVDGELGPQLAYNGHPLYYFSGDAAAGDFNGQGSGEVWFVVDAAGNAIT